MSHPLKICVLLAVFVLVACGDATGAQALYEGVETPSAHGSMSGQILQEIEALQSILTFPRILFFPLVIAAAWLFAGLQRQLAHLLLRIGVRSRRRILAVSSIVTIAVWVWAIATVATRLLRAAPTLTLAAGTLTAVFLLVGLSRQVENVAAGLGLALRGRIEEGDQVTIGEHTGMVRRVGLIRVQLRTSEGDLIYIPNRKFASEVVTVGRTRHSYPLVVELVRERPWDAVEVERARACATLSPYRDPHSRVAVNTTRDDAHTLSVEIQVWMSRLLPAAERHLRVQLSTSVETGTKPRSVSPWAYGDKKAADERELRPRTARLVSHLRD